MNLSTILRNHGIDIAKSGGDGGINTTILPTTLTTEFDNQKTWDIPVGRYDAETDSMIVFHNTIYLNPSSYNLTGDAGSGYKLNIPDAPDTPIVDNNVAILVFKNYAEEGSLISGTQLSDGSISLDKLGQDIQDFIKNGQAEIVDNLTTNDNSKVLAASQGVVIKSELDRTLKVNTNSPENIHQNLNKNYAVKQFNTFSWANSTNSELLEISIPTRLGISGVFKLTLSSSVDNSNAGGGAEIHYHIATTPTASSIYENKKEIFTMSGGMSSNYYIKDAVINNSTVTFGIIKRKNANRLSVKIEYQTVNDNAYEVLSSSVALKTTLSNVVPETQYPRQTSLVGTTVRHTVANLNYYIDANNGDDVTGDGTQAKPFKTIEKAINNLPQVINHGIQINLNKGTYAEDIVIDGKSGEGSIVIRGNSQSMSDVTVRSVRIRKCSIPVSAGMMTVVPDNDALIVLTCQSVYLYNFTSTNNSQAGLRVDSSNVHLHGCVLSNKSFAVLADELATVLVKECTGTGNSWSLLARTGSTIIKSGNVPSGTNGQQAQEGGLIR